MKPVIGQELIGGSLLERPALELVEALLTRIASLHLGCNAETRQ